MANLLADLPQCGLSCLVASIPSSPCASSNLTCLCDDTTFTNVLQTCVLGNCTVREALSVKNITSRACGIPISNQDTTILFLTIFLFTTQAIFFFLRMLCRAARIAPWGWDDTTIVVAFLAIMAFLPSSQLEKQHGIGRNTWDVPPDQITEFLKLFYIYEIIYVFTLSVIKISICCLYLRVFSNPRFKKVVLGTIVFNTCILIAFVFAEMFQCSPISYFWTNWDGTHVGYCNDITSLAWANSILNIIVDFWMLGLPATQVWGLNLPLKRKLNIMAMFGFGLFLTIVSIVRVYNITRFVRSKNPTMDFYGVSIWSCIEITAGLTVACMPGARLYVAHCLDLLVTKFHASRGHSIDKSKPRYPSDAVPGLVTIGGTTVPHSLSDHDKNRRSLVTSTVRSDRKVRSSSGDEASGACNTLRSLEEGIMPLPLLTERTGSEDRIFSPLTGEYLGVPDRLMTPHHQDEQSWEKAGSAVSGSSESSTAMKEKAEGDDRWAEKGDS